MRSKYITQRNGWTFRKGCIEKHNFYASKDPIDVNDDDIERLVASSKYPIEKKLNISLIIQLIPMII